MGHSLAVRKFNMCLMDWFTTTGRSSAKGEDPEAAGLGSA